jgi:two-component system LytT family sensor kinase
MLDQHLVILLVKLAVAASLASILTRSGRFQRMLMREERTLAQRVQMALVSALSLRATESAVSGTPTRRSISAWREAW